MADLTTIIELAKQRGYVEYADLQPFIPSSDSYQNQVQGIIKMLTDMGIEIRKQPEMS